MPLTSNKLPFFPPLYKMPWLLMPSHTMPTPIWKARKLYLHRSVSINLLLRSYRKPTLLTGSLAEAEVINPTTTPLTTGANHLIGPPEGDAPLRAGVEADPHMILGLPTLLELVDMGKLLHQQLPLHLHLHAHLHLLMHCHLCKHHKFTPIDNWGLTPSMWLELSTINCSISLNSMFFMTLYWDFCN